MSAENKCTNIAYFAVTWPDGQVLDLCFEHMEQQAIIASILHIPIVVKPIDNNLLGVVHCDYARNS